MKRILIFTGIFLGIFAGLDRFVFELVPLAYRQFPDKNRFHSLYFSQKIGLLKEPEILVLGDSRSRHGVLAEHLSKQAFNLAAASAGVPFQKKLLKSKALINFDKLQLIIWGVSPRIFNAAWSDPVHEKFSRSSGFLHAASMEKIKSGQLTEKVDALSIVSFEEGFSYVARSYAFRSLLKARILDAIIPANRFSPEPYMQISQQGFMHVPEHQKRNLDAQELKRYLQSHQQGAFYLNDKIWNEFQELIALLKQKNIKLFLFIPPMHPVLEKAGVADHDGTPRPEYQELVEKLKNLADNNIAFADYHRAGRNNFQSWENADHLAEAGALQLTEYIKRDGHKAGFLSKSPPAAVSGLEEVAGRGTSAKSVGKESAGVKAFAYASAGAASKADRFFANILNFLTGSLAANPADKTPPGLKHNRAQNYTIVDMNAEPFPLFRVDYSDSQSGLDLSSARFYLNDIERTSEMTVTPTHMTFKPFARLDTGMYRARFEISDKAGNKATIIWDIMYQEC